MRGPALVIGVLCVIVPAAASAQNVVPGLSLHTLRTSGPDTVVYQRTVTRDGRDTSAGTRTVVMTVTRGPGGTRLLEIEQRFPASVGGEIVDTAVADFRTLRAVAHRSHQPTRTMRFDFVDNDAVGSVVMHRAAGDSIEAVRQPLGGPIFDSNVIDLVVAALPLRSGFTVEVPFFIYERGGRVPMQVTVRERGPVVFPLHGRRDVWIVTVGVPGAPATVWVDSETGAVLRIRYDIAARNLSFTDERTTRLR